jgi:hypothetical protein
MLPAGRARSSVLLVLIGVAMLLVSGCATTRRVPDSTAVAGGADRVPEPLPAGDRAFIEESLSLLASRAAQAAQAPQAAAPRDAESPPEPPGPLSAAPGEPSPTNQRPSGIGGRFSVERVVGFVSFSNWEMGRELLRETGILADAGVDRLGRVVFVTERDRAMLFLDVDSRRLPVAWSLLRSPWKRVSRGQWRDPATGATLELRRNASWIYSRGGVPLATGAGDGATDVTVGSTRPPTIGATAWETLDLLHRRSVDVPSEGAVRAVFWTNGIEVSGLPAGLVPETATLAFFDGAAPEGGGTITFAPVGEGETEEARRLDDGQFLAAIAFPFDDERAARTASVAARLLVPAFLEGTGVEIDARSGIVREGEVIILRDVAIERQLVDGIMRRLAP